MAETVMSAPILFTPDDHILAGIDPILPLQPSQQLSEDEFRIRYEIDRTLAEIRANKWQRVALQFPDDLLPHSARVFQTLSRSLSSDALRTKRTAAQKIEDGAKMEHVDQEDEVEGSTLTKFTILADTSYGSCCVDEIAGEHLNADAIIHYGRACLSPTARLPVLYVYTTMPLDLAQAKQAFISAFPDPTTQVMITADIPYSTHIEPLTTLLANSTYKNLYPATVIRDPSSAIPNRTVPQSVSDDPSSLSDWHVFHIAEPPTALLLSLSSRVASIQVYDVKSVNTDPSNRSIEANTVQLLRRRYALVTSMSTVSVWGILINTLSVKNYLHVVEHVKRQITDADKRFYLFVVGKINAAKVANFSEIGGWVVIGCWESSLIDSKDFFRPILTPFELEMALMRDDRRIWSGAWSSNFQELLDRDQAVLNQSKLANGIVLDTTTHDPENEDAEVDIGSEDESAPPEFDLRTGRLISRSGPVKPTRQYNEIQDADISAGRDTKAVTRRAKGDIVAVNGFASPAGEYLKEKRMWKGLGSDFEIRYEDDSNLEGAPIEEGRTGVAGGYSVGDSAIR